MERQFFSGNTIEQAVMAAARHFGLDPSHVAYKIRDKKHGFLNIRRRVVIEVDPTAPEQAPPEQTSPEGLVGDAGDSEAGIQTDAGEAGLGDPDREDSDPEDSDQEDSVREDSVQEDAGPEDPVQEDAGLEDPDPEGYRRGEDAVVGESAADEGESDDPFGDEKDGLSWDESENEAADEVEFDAEPHHEESASGSDQPEGADQPSHDSEGWEADHTSTDRANRGQANSDRAKSDRARTGRTKTDSSNERPSRRRRGRERSRERDDEIWRHRRALTEEFAEAKSDSQAESEDQEIIAFETALKEIIELVEMELEIKVTREDDLFQIELEGEDGEFLVERDGLLLRAVEHLLPRMVRGLLGHGLPCRLDCNGFQAAREQEIREMAGGMAELARRQGKPQKLAPMSPADRRLVHLALADDPTVTTESEGSGYMKRVKVLPA